MFKALLKVKLSAFFYRMSGGTAKKRTHGRALLFGALMLYVAGVFAVLMGRLFKQIIMPFHAIGVDWLYFGIMGMLSFAIVFLFSLFTTGAQLYEAKDNERLLSMPIPTGYILGSRIVSLLIEDYIYELIVAVPAAVVWCGTFRTDAIWWISFILTVLCIPLFTFAVTGVFSYVLNRLLSAVKNKTVTSVLFTVAFLAVYFLIYGRINEYVEALVQNGSAVSVSIYNAARPVYWLGASLAEGKPVYLLFVVLICVFVFSVIYVLLSLTFIKATTTKRGVARKKYEKRNLKVSSPMSAFVRKEFSRIGASPTYIMNSGIGILLMLALPVLMLIKREEIFTKIDVIRDYAAIISAFAVCFASSTVTFSAPSVSLEGKSIWIPLSLPIEAGVVLRAKILTHLYIALPAVCISAGIMSAVFYLDAVNTAAVLAAAAAYTLFCAVLGVTVNVKHPKLDWVNEVQVIKQGMSLLISLLINIAVLIAAGFLYMAVLYNRVSGALFLAGFAAALAITSVLMYKYLNGSGAKRFEAIAS